VQSKRMLTTLLTPNRESRVPQEIQSLELEIQELENAPGTEDSVLDEKKGNLTHLKRHLANATRTGLDMRTPAGAREGKQQQREVGRSGGVVGGYE